MTKRNSFLRGELRIYRTRSESSPNQQGPPKTMPIVKLGEPNGSSSRFRMPPLAVYMGDLPSPSVEMNSKQRNPLQKSPKRLFRQLVRRKRPVGIVRRLEFRPPSGSLVFHLRIISTFAVSLRREWTQVVELQSQRLLEISFTIVFSTFSRNGTLAESERGWSSSFYENRKLLQAWVKLLFSSITDAG